MMEILFKNQDWLVINKPTGLSSHAAFPGDIGVQEWVELHWGEKPHIFSRLDKGTSGVMVMARCVEAARRAESLMCSEGTLKRYVFLSDRDSSWRAHKTDWITQSRVDGKEARTEFRKLGAAGRYYLYQADLKQGRLHQIRRHAKESGIPVLGDVDYGGGPYPRLCLHCKETTWPEIPEKLIAPLPASLGSLGDFKDDPGFLASFDRRLNFHSGVTDAFRCLHRGEMRALDCAIDYYGSFLCVWIYEEARSLDDVTRILQPHLKKLFSHYGAKGCVFKRSLKDPHRRGLVNEQILIGEAPPAFFKVKEHGLKYHVGLTEEQHVGLFLDQRDNRLRVRRLSQGRRVANLFSYTCSFSVAAVAGDAEAVFSVDAAGPCLTIGKENFKLNGFSESGRGKFIQEDARHWLDKQKLKGEKFGIIICDPPTFSSTRSGGVFSVEREWERLVAGCRDLLEEGGHAFFSTNHRKGGKDYYRQILRSSFSEIVDLVPPIDFPEISGNPESVKMFWCRGG